MIRGHQLFFLSAYIESIRTISECVHYPHRGMIKTKFERLTSLIDAMGAGSLRVDLVSNLYR